MLFEMKCFHNRYNTVISRRNMIRLELSARNMIRKIIRNLKLYDDEMLLAATTLQ